MIFLVIYSINSYCSFSFLTGDYNYSQIQYVYNNLYITRYPRFRRGWGGGGVDRGEYVASAYEQ